MVLFVREQLIAIDRVVQSSKEKVESISRETIDSMKSPNAKEMLLKIEKITKN